MADQIVTLRLTSDPSGLITGGVVARRELASVGSTAEHAGARGAAGMKRMESSVSGLSPALARAQTAFLAVFSFAALQRTADGLSQIADRYSNITAQIRLASDSQSAYARAEAEVYAISQRTSSALESTANLYARLTRSTSEYGLSQQRVLNLSETINQTFAVSGTATAAQANAITQLTQAFAGGVLRAEEFNSVIENSPRLAQALADGMGIGIGQLRALVNEGEVTVEKIVSALESQTGAIETEFSRMPLTIERAWTQLENAVTRYIGQADQASGASANLAEFLQRIANNVDEVVAVAEQLATLLIIRLAGTAIPAAIAGFRAMATQAALTAISMEVMMGAGTVSRAAILTSSIAGIGRALAALAGGPVGVALLAIYGLYKGWELLRESIEKQGAGARAIEDMASAAERLSSATSTFDRSADGLEAFNAQLTQSRELAKQGYEELIRAQERLANIRDGFVLFKDAAYYDSLREARQEVEALTARLEALIGTNAQAANAADAHRKALDVFTGAARAADAAMSALGSQTATLTERNKDLQDKLNALHLGDAAVQADNARDQLTSAIAAIGERADAEMVATRSFGSTMRNTLSSIVDAYAEYDKTRELIAKNDALAKQLEREQDALRDGRKAVDDAAKSAQSYMDTLRDQAASYGLSGKAQALYLLGKQQLTAAQRQEVQTLINQIATMESLAETYEDAARALEDLRGMSQSLDDQIIDLQDQIGGADQAQIEFNRTLRDAAAAYAEAAAASDPSALDAYVNAVNRAREVLNLRRTLDEQQTNLRASEETARQTERVWTQMYSSLADAFGAWVADGAKSFSDFADDMRSIMKRMIADLISQMVQSGLMRMMAGLFGGGTSGVALAGGGSGGGGFNLGSFFGGNGSSAAMPWLAALGAASYGASNPGNNGFASAARIGTYAYTGWALGTVGLGAGLGAAGAAAGAGIGAAAGGAATGAMGAAAAIPVVGWIIAALALIDAVSGGKLFGTRYRAQSVEQQLNIGSGGGDATTLLNETRQAALFGGIRRRTRTIDSSDEAIAAAEGLFDQIRQTMETSAQQLMIDAPEVFEAAIRTVSQLDKKGKVKSSKIFVDILGRTWEEATEELAVTRLNAEAIIATIDASLAATQAATADATFAAIEGGFMAGLDRARVGVEQDASRFAVDAFGNVRDTRLPEGGGGNGPVQTDPTGTAAILGEASQIAERWRGNAERLMEGAQFLLTAATAMRRGTEALQLGSLTAITDIVEDLAYSGETLVQTYQRISTATQLLDEAMALAGVTTDRSREAIVRFAVDVVEAAGSLDRATQLWTGYFNSFYSEQERAVNALEQMLAATSDQFDDIGLNVSDYTGEGGLAAFRALLESQMAELSAEALVEWLEAANALAALVDAQSAYNASIEEAVQAELDRIAALQAAQAEYRSFIVELQRETANLSDYQRSMLEAEDWRSEAIAQANAHARAAGMAGASEQALALVELRAAQLRAQALAQLQRETQSLVDQLYGNSSTTTANDGMQSALDAADDYWASQRQNAETLQAYLDSMLLGDLSALTPAEQLSEAWRQLNAAVGSGDAQRATQLADVYLRMLRGAEASGDDYNNGFNRDGTEIAGFWDVRALLQGMLAGINPGPNNGAPGTSFTPITLADAEQVAAQNRLDLAVQLAQHLRDLSGAVGQTVFELMESMGVDLRALTADLGINLQTITSESVLALVNMADLLGTNLTTLTTELGLTLTDLGTGIRELAEQMGIDLSALTIESTQALGTLANQLGIDLSALASAVGTDLGSLADAQSLLNQALGAHIDALPQDQRDQLAPLFDAIAAATTAADANTAIGALESAINLLAPDLRNELAPYLEGVFPADALSDLDYLTEISASAAAQVSALDIVNATLERIASNLGAANEAAGIPSYAVGTGNVPRTGLATIHEGEAIIPAPFASWLRSNGFPVIGGGSDNEALRSELRAVRAELALVVEAVHASGAHVATTVDNVGARSDKAVDASLARNTMTMGRSTRG
jgi:tape measure domain-containing protein